MLADYEPPMPSPEFALIVRLRNWVGDVTLGVPTLQRLADAGYALQLIGKRWAGELLAGYGWHMHVLPPGLAERVALMRRLKGEARSTDAGFTRRLNALCLPYSFSSALEFRLAGLRAIGHAHEGRSLLLAAAQPRLDGVHELCVYWDLGNALLRQQIPPPASIGLRVAPQHRAEAAALRQAHGIEPGYVVVCPFAGGTWARQDKTWPSFAELVASQLPRHGRTVVICPGPGEEALAREHYPSAKLLPEVGLGVYAGLLQNAALMVANDTGPGHIAAAVGTPLISVLGPTDAAQWGAWGPSVRVLQGDRQSANPWPTVAAVDAAVAQLLSGR